MCPPDGTVKAHESGIPQRVAPTGLKREPMQSEAVQGLAATAANEEFMKGPRKPALRGCGGEAASAPHCERTPPLSQRLGGVEERLRLPPLPAENKGLSSPLSHSSLRLLWLLCCNAKGRCRTCSRGCREIVRGL